MAERAAQDNRLFKFVVLAILILIFITVATVKIWELRIAAERVGVLHTLGSLRSAVGIQLSAVVIREGTAALTQLDRSNPMRLWSPPPSSYLGEFTAAEAPDAQGAWYYDLDQQMLIYRVRFTDYFTTDNSDYPGLARYQLRFDYHDNNSDQLFDPTIDTAIAVSLQPVDRYHWLLEPSPIVTP